MKYISIILLFLISFEGVAQHILKSPYDIIYTNSGETILVSNIQNKRPSDPIKCIDFLEKEELKLNSQEIKRIELFKFPIKNNKIYYSTKFSFEESSRDKILILLKEFLTKDSLSNKFIGSYNEEGKSVFRIICNDIIALAPMQKKLIRKKMGVQNGYELHYTINITLNSDELEIEVNDIKILFKNTLINEGKIKITSPGSNVQINLTPPALVNIEKLHSYTYLNELHLNRYSSDYNLFFSNNRTPKFLNIANYHKILSASASSKIIEYRENNSNNIKRIANLLNHKIEEIIKKEEALLTHIQPKTKDFNIEDRQDDILSLLKLFDYEEIVAKGSDYKDIYVPPYVTNVCFDKNNLNQLNFDNYFDNDMRVIKNNTAYNIPSNLVNFDMTWKNNFSYKTGGFDPELFNATKLNFGEIKAIQEYLENNTSKSILANIAGRNDKGEFNAQSIVDVGNKIINDHSISINDNLEINRQIEELGLLLMQKAYILVYIPFNKMITIKDKNGKVTFKYIPSSRLEVFRIKVNRDDLSKYAKEYWIDKKSWNIDMVNKYNLLKIPLEYIGSTSSELTNISQNTLNNLANDFEDFKVQSSNLFSTNKNNVADTVVGMSKSIENDSLTVSNFKDSTTNTINISKIDNHKALLNSFYKKAEELSMNKKNVNYFYLTEKRVVPNLGEKEFVSGIIKIVNSSKNIRQIGGKQLYEGIGVKSAKRLGINMSIEYNPFYDLSSHGINFLLGFSIRKNRKGLTSLEYIVSYSKGSFYTDVGQIAFRNFPTINGKKTLSLYSFSVCSFAFRHYLTKKGNLYLKPELGWGAAGVSEYAGPDSEFSTFFLKMKLGIYHYLNHHINVFVTPQLISRGPFNFDEINSVLPRNTGGWSKEFSQLDKSFQNTSITLGLNFEF